MQMLQKKNSIQYKKKMLNSEFIFLYFFSEFGGSVLRALIHQSPKCGAVIQMNRVTKFV